MVNKASLPYGEEVDTELPRHLAVKLYRWARAIRKKRAHAARIAFVTRKWGKKMTVHEVQELRQGRMKGRSAEFLKELHVGLRDCARDHSITLGCPALPAGGAVTLTFRGSVELVGRWIEYLQKDFSAHRPSVRAGPSSSAGYLSGYGAGGESRGNSPPRSLGDCRPGGVMAFS